MIVWLTNRTAALLSCRAAYSLLLVLLLLVVMYLPDSLLDFGDDYNNLKVGMYTARLGGSPAVYVPTEAAFVALDADPATARVIQSCTQVALLLAIASLFLFAVAVFAGNHPGLRCCTVCVDVATGVFSIVASIEIISVNTDIGPGMPILALVGLMSCCTPLCACFLQPSCVEGFRHLAQDNNAAAGGNVETKSAVDTASRFQ
ncbi:hypothetical protein DIPPA_62634 [Diplonema papillatum]|nr:hypothetical protein DIPPA_62634 [Diplonema papillatum]